MVFVLGDKAVLVLVVVGHGVGGPSNHLLMAIVACLLCWFVFTIQIQAFADLLLVEFMRS
jgi:hypothetical protein